MLEDCEGIFGYIFGHNFRDIYNTEEGPVPDILLKKYFQGYEGYEMAQLFDEAKSKKETYVHSICKRCGIIVKEK